MPRMVERVLTFTLLIQEPALDTLTSKTGLTGVRLSQPVMPMRMEMDTELTALVLLLARNTVSPRKPTFMLSRS